MIRWFDDEEKSLTAAIEGIFVASGDGWVTSAPTIMHGSLKQGGLKKIILYVHKTQIYTSAQYTYSSSRKHLSQKVLINI